MTPQRWERVNAIWHGAIMCPVEGRPDYLDRECDADLRAEVEELLQQDALAEEERFLTRFSSRNAGETVRDPSLPESALLPRRLGPYEILESIGHGGMGSVYRAVRVNDYKQVVAIKFLKQGFASSDSVRRFQTERQVLATLNHPNIARLLDGGTTPEGLPYLVMEYIAGKSLDRYCDERELSIRNRLEIFASVCRTIEYAHQRTIIHRDIKPSNILVVEDGTVKVTDFGLAKQVADADRTIGDQATQSGAVFGTPSYMAPEQASGVGAAITLKSDIYSLGAVLYELLTGRPPHRGETPLKTLFQVLHDEPVPPRRLDADVPRDVETICLKCLRKEPEARYSSAAALADDIEHFLAGRPIQARPIGPVARSFRWCRRRPVVAGLLALLFLVFAGGLSGVISLWVLAERRAVALQQQKDEAARQRDQARLAVDEMYTQVAEDWLAAEPHMQELQRDFLAKALAHYQTLESEGNNDREIRHRTAQAYYRIGIIQSKLGADTAKVVESFRRAIAYWKQLIEEFPREWKYARDLFHSYKMLQHLVPDAPEATTYYAELLVDRFPDHADSWDILANHLFSRGMTAMGLGEYAEAERLFRRGVEVAREMSARKPSEPFYKKNIATNSRGLGLLYAEQDRLDEAEEQLRAALSVAADIAANPGTKFTRLDARNLQVELTQYQSNLASLLGERGKLTEAEQLFEQALKGAKQFVEQYDDLYGHQFQLSCIHLQFGTFYVAAKRPAEAKKQFEFARDLLELLVPKFPEISYATKGHLSNFYSTCPIVELRQERRAIQLAKDVIKITGNESTAQRHLGVALYRAGDWSDSVPVLEKARSGVAAADAEIDFYLAMAHHHLGDTIKARSHFDQAVKLMGNRFRRSLGPLRTETELLLGVR